jgi:hypothetical protein
LLEKILLPPFLQQEIAEFYHDTLMVKMRVIIKDLMMKINIYTSMREKKLGYEKDDVHMIEMMNNGKGSLPAGQIN